MRTTVYPILIAAALGCGGAAHEAPPSGGMNPPPEATEEPKAGGPDMPSASPAAEGPKEATPMPAPKPKSTATIAGASISEVDGTALQKELKKLGWLEPNTSVGGMDVGEYQNVRTDIKKGKAKGYVEIIRPSSGASGGSTKMVPPKEQKDSRDKEGAATFYDEAADVLVVVSVEGKPADGKRLLSSLVKKK